MTTVICVASGPSRTPAQEELVRTARIAGKCRVIVVNRAWEAVPNADVLYAADTSWWLAPEFGRRALREFCGECWTASAEAARSFGLCLIDVKNGVGVSSDPASVMSGANGGYQAIGLARRFLRDDPEKRIVLVGYDMQHTGGRRHCHEDYPDRIDVDGKKLTFGNAGSVSAWAKNYAPLATALAAEGFEVINCSIETALTCFPRADLASTLERLV